MKHNGTSTKAATKPQQNWAYTYILSDDARLIDVQISWIYGNTIEAWPTYTII